MDRLKTVVIKKDKTKAAFKFNHFACEHHTNLIIFNIPLNHLPFSLLFCVEEQTGVVDCIMHCIKYCIQGGASQRESVSIYMADSIRSSCLHQEGGVLLTYYLYYTFT